MRPRDGHRRERRRAAARALRFIAAVVLGVAVAGACYAYLRLRASLPLLDGTAALVRLGGEVVVERDVLGVPTVRGASRLDVARASGFLHAQDRFFQMDLLRRRAAGELAELFGPVALEVDRKTRRHRFRAVAARVLDLLPARARALLEAYTEGVNAGLSALRDRPFEYLLLRAAPAAWRPEDSILAIHAMFIDLNGEDDAYEATLGVLAHTVPRPLFDLLAPIGGEWDAPLSGGVEATPPLPGSDVVDLRARAAPPPRSRSLPDEHRVPGSNSWAVAGTRTAHGGAMVADDMHLGLGVPNIWYRAALVWGEASRGRRVAGVMLPGAPVVVAGSTERVAWGFTNSQGDFQDLVEVEPDPHDAGRYLAPGGARPFERTVEVLHVKGGPDERLEVLATIWGPVVDEDHRHRRRALAWTAHHPEAVNLELWRLEEASTVEEALDVANTAGVPPQNFVCADARGRIGWTIAGVLPRRVGFDGRLPGSWADGTRRWDGWSAPRGVPRIVNPPSGQLWTANSRVVDGPALAVVGDGGYVLGARARQIRDDLSGRNGLSERDLLAIQLDDRALFLTRWQGLLLDLLSPSAIAADPRRREVRRSVERWGGRAAIDSVGYGLVRSFRLAVIDRALAPFLREARRLDPGLDLGQLPQVEGLVWRLVRERPAHLLEPAEGSWEGLLLGALDDVLAALPDRGRDLASRTWGASNTTDLRHPLSSAVPGLGWLLDLRAEPLPGDDHMPRVQGPSFGASERMVVSPGREQEGIFHMPGGQSGHPLSPYYRAGHEAWARGESTPFLPGPPRHLLRLVPGP